MKQEHKNRIFEMITKHHSLMDMEGSELSELMKELKPEDTNKWLDENVRAIISNVEFATGITFDDMKSKKRQRKFVIARQLAMYKLRTEYRYFMTLKEIGEIFNRDHATVSYACRIVGNCLETNDPLFKKVLENYESADLIAA